MVHRKNWRWPVALAVGLIAGLMLGGLWPSAALHAVATDRCETYAMATGPLDQDIEAVYLLDFLTGDLGAFVLGRQPGLWSGFFRRNVSADLGVDPQKNPKFLMVTGVTAMRRGSGGRTPWSGSVCYVFEVTSGRLAAYAIPWSAPTFAAGQPQISDLKLVGVTQCRQGMGTGVGGVPKFRERP